MTTEAVENQELPETQDDEAQAFAAGFAEGRGDEPPLESEAAAELVPEEPPQRALIAGLTEDQVKNLLLKAGEVDKLSAQLEKAFGKVGEVNRTIQQLQAQRSGGNGLSSTQLKRLSGEYPELAELLASDLNEAFQNGSGGSQQPAYDSQQFEQMLSARAEEVRIGLERDMEKRLLKREHRDWEEVVMSDDFKLWKQNVLPAEDSERLGASWDSEFISDKLAEFKDWKSKATTSKESKQKRLEAAITPRGDATGPNTIQSEEEAFAAAFKQARSNRLY